MINERQIRKELEARKKEMSELQATLDRATYEKQLAAFNEIFNERSELIDIIRDKHLSRDDVKILATTVCQMIPQIYMHVESKVKDNQEKRKRRNASRQQRRAKKNDVANLQVPVEQYEMATSPANDSSGALPPMTLANTELTSDTAEVDDVMRRY